FCASSRAQNTEVFFG
nr:T cell receptor V beta-chain, TCR V beta {V-D-J regions, clone Vb20} [rats, ACI-to-LEW cardiac allograft-infiltrating lymphocytes, Peptide Partial, 15 aa] [Rattus sp.]